MISEASKPKINVGFWFDYGLQYAGGLNYFWNLLYAVHQTRTEDIRIILFIGYGLPQSLEDEFSQVAKVVKLNLLTRGTVEWFFHRLAYRVLRSQFFVERILRHYKIDVVSHPSMVEQLSRRFRLISWIPDFQYLHLPHFFPKLHVRNRNAELRTLYSNSDAVVVSCEDAYKDLAKVLGKERPARTHVLPFVSQLRLGEISQDDVRALLKKFGLPERYLFLPNQFWAHKNHRTAFQAVAQLKKEGVDVTLVCTGWIKDPNGNSFIEEALRVIKDEGLHRNVRLLGSIDYKDVLGLMRSSVAVVNPSYFEGWSSSVEEAKSLGKPLIASNLAVHREQAHPNALYFDPDDPSSLAKHLRTAWLAWPSGVAHEQEAAARKALDQRTIEFGQRYIQILKDVSFRAPKPDALHFLHN